MEKPHFSTITVPAKSPFPASRHGKIEQLAPDIFFVRGRMHSTAARGLFARLFIHFSRTMTVVRHLNEKGDYELTLYNTIRLSDAGLMELGKLGKIKNIVRLGSFHGVDDAFYVQKYQANYWMVGGMNIAEGLAIKPQFLSQSPDDNGPIPGAQFFLFNDVRYPEAICILPGTVDRPGVAITTDSIQNHTSIWDIDNSWLVSFGIWRIGLVGAARLGPIWMRELAPQPSRTLDAGCRRRAMKEFFHPQFEKLLRDYNFDMLLPGHGWPIRHNAKEAIKRSISEQLSV